MGSGVSTSEHRLVSESGEALAFVLRGERFTEVRGPWPEGRGELVFRRGIPPHRHLVDLPAHVVARAEAQGVHVCAYDPNSCRTCYCDGGGQMLRCVAEC